MLEITRVTTGSICILWDIYLCGTQIGHITYYIKTEKWDKNQTLYGSVLDRDNSLWMYIDSLYMNKALEKCKNEVADDAVKEILLGE